MKSEVDRPPMYPCLVPSRPSAPSRLPVRSPSKRRPRRPARPRGAPSHDPGDPRRGRGAWGQEKYTAPPRRPKPRRFAARVAVARVERTCSAILRSVTSTHAPVMYAGRPCLSAVEQPSLGCRPATPPGTPSRSRPRRPVRAVPSGGLLGGRPSPTTSPIIGAAASTASTLIGAAHRRDLAPTGRRPGSRPTSVGRGANP